MKLFEIEKNIFINKNIIESIEIVENEKYIEDEMYPITVIEVAVTMPSGETYYVDEETLERLKGK